MKANLFKNLKLFDDSGSLDSDDDFWLQLLKP